MSRIDIAIIGSGPAGISAALTATARNQNIILFGSSGQSDKVSKAHLVRNYPGLPDISGEDFAKALQSSLDAMGIETRKEQVANIYAMGDYFAIRTSGGMYEASAVILATGVTQGKPLPGENDFLGRGISYCATCDAFLYKDKTVVVLGYSEEAQHEAEFLAETCEKVYYYPVKGDANFQKDNIEVMNGKPISFVGGMKAETLETSEGSVNADGFFILKDAVSADVLVPGLEMADNHVVVDLDMKTNLPGLFACGDIAGRPYQYVKSAGQGNVAALSAVSYLTANKK